MTTASSPLEDYQDRFSGSAALHGRAAEVLAGGAAHDLWDTHPFSRLLRAGQGSLQVGPREQPLHRLLDRTRGAPLRPRVRAGPGSGRNPARHGHPPHCARGSPDPLGRAGLCARAQRRAGALHVIGHRGHHARPAGRTRPHRAPARHQVRRPLPRLARRGAERLQRTQCRRPANPLSGELRSLFPCTDIAAACRRMEHRDVAAVILEPGGAAAAGRFPGRRRISGRCGRRPPGPALSSSSTRW